MYQVATHLNIQTEARTLYGLGFSIAPTRPYSKKPYKYIQLTYTRINPEYIPRMFYNGRGLLVVVGRISRNLFIIDCETVQAADRIETELARRNIKPWIVETARGKHFWLLSQENELANVPLNARGNTDFEIVAHSKYCLVPPSVHPTSGVIYQWQSRQGDLPDTVSIHQLDFLPVSFRNSGNRQAESFIQNGAKRGQRNNTLFKAACTLRQSGYELEDASEKLSPSAIESGLSQREIDSTIRSAYRQRTYHKRNRMSDAELAEQFLHSHQWVKLPVQGSNGKTVKISANSLRSVFEACVTRSKLERSSTFRASEREVSELAQVDNKTANKGLRALKQNDYLLDAGKDETSKSNLYAFSLKVLSHSSPTINTVESMGERRDSLDIWEHRGLGKTGKRIFYHLQQPDSANGIIQRLGISKPTVHRKLRQLSEHGLATKNSEGLWVAVPFDTEREQAIAESLGTLKKTELRRKKHELERSKSITREIMHLIEREERTSEGL